MNRYLVMRGKTEGEYKQIRFTGRYTQLVAAGCWRMWVLVISICVNEIGPRLE